MALGHWGARWIGSRLKRDQLDAGFLMWDIRRFVRLDEFPRGRTVVIQFRFTDARAGERRWWLVVENGSADLCRDDPGHELTLVVESTVRALTEIWTGDREPAEVIASRALRVSGAPRDARDLWRWLGRSAFAETRAACSPGRLNTAPAPECARWFPSHLPPGSPSASRSSSSSSPPGRSRPSAASCRRPSSPTR